MKNDLHLANSQAAAVGGGLEMVQHLNGFFGRRQSSSASYSDRPAGWIVCQTISRPTRLGGRSPNSEPLLTAIAPVSLFSSYPRRYPHRTGSNRLGFKLPHDN